MAPRIRGLQVLLEAGADVDTREWHGRNVLHILAADRSTDNEGRRKAATSMLLKAGADRVTIPVWLASLGEAQSW